MEYNKDSEVIIISAYAQGYYSGSEAYGEAYIPYDFYLEYKGEIEAMSVYVNELDGKHSESECDIEFERDIIEKIITDKVDYDEYEQDVSDMILEYMFEDMEISDTVKIAIEEFNTKLTNTVFNRYEDKKLITDKNIEISNVLIPEGTLLSFQIEDKEAVPKDWKVELVI